MKNLYLTVPVGQSVRDFLVLGLTARLLDRLPDFRTVLLTPAYNVPEFLELCPKDDRLLIRRMELPIGGRNWRLIHWRRKILRNRTAIRSMLKWEAGRFRPPHYLKQTFDELPPSLVVSTHPLLYHDYEVVTWARRLGIQTAGVVKSWDNVGKGLSTQPHLLSVWNPLNKKEAVGALGYRDAEVEINGGPSFDAYFDPTYHLPRNRFLADLGLDPSRPLITLATCGVLDKGYYCRDETHLADDLLRMISESPVLRKSQLVIRLHPSSRLEHFWRYRNQPDIKFSFASYMPGITWCPTKKDLIEQINLLKCSNVIVTPASSWSLEAAIFNTPTVVPVYSDRQPDHATAQFDQWTLARHFRPILAENLLPLTRSYDDTRAAMEEALTNPCKYAKQRKAIVQKFIYHSDSRSCERISSWIAKIAETAIPGSPRGL